MYGAILGDIIGSRFEGRRRAIKSKDFELLGGDYTIDKIPEAKIVQSYGGKVELVQFVAGHSTTNILKRLSKGE